MTEEIELIEQQLRDQYGAGALAAGTGAAGEEPPLEIIDRDNAALEDDDRSMSIDLQSANAVGLSTADVATSPIGTSYDHDLEHVVGVRIEGAHADEWGHIDPDGQDGAPFDSLVRFVRRAILRLRRFPTPGTPNVNYHSLRIDSETPLASGHGDYFRHDLDARFDGFETLP